MGAITVCTQAKITITAQHPKTNWVMIPFQPQVERPTTYFTFHTTEFDSVLRATTADVVNL